MNCRRQVSRLHKGSANLHLGASTLSPDYLRKQVQVDKSYHTLATYIVSLSVCLETRSLCLHVRNYGEEVFIFLHLLLGASTAMITLYGTT